MRGGAKGGGGTGRGVGKIRCESPPESRQNAALRYELAARGRAAAIRRDARRRVAPKPDGAMFYW